MKNRFQHVISIGASTVLLSAAFGPGLARAQSGSAGGSIGNDEKSLSGSREAPRAVESPKPARRAKPESDEPRRASRRSGGEGSGAGGGGNFDGTWVAVATGTPCGSSTERFRRFELRVGQPERRHEDRRLGIRFELDQYRPFLGPERLRFVRENGRMYRTLERF
jgi:hypothetical protein